MSSARKSRNRALSSQLEWGVASRPLPGEAALGDAHFVHESPSAIVIGVLDALGHGDEAAATARLAVDTLAQYRDEPIESLIQRCHHALIGSRGIVVSLAAFDFAECTMTWLGIGDVEGHLVLADRSAVPSQLTLVRWGGIVGGRLPAIRPSILPISDGDMLVLMTDGVRPALGNVVYVGGSPQLIADHLLAGGFKGSDDGLVLVARVRDTHGERG